MTALSLQDQLIAKCRRGVLGPSVLDPVFPRTSTASEKSSRRRSMAAIAPSSRIPEHAMNTDAVSFDVNFFLLRGY
jgi:hypothetical protein